MKTTPSSSNVRRRPGGHSLRARRSETVHTPPQGNATRNLDRTIGIDAIKRFDNLVNVRWGKGKHDAGILASPSRTSRTEGEGHSLNTRLRFAGSSGASWNGCPTAL